MIAGEGGSQDTVEAKRLLDLAVSAGDGRAALIRARLAKSSGSATAADIERDLRLAMRSGLSDAYFDLASLKGPLSKEGREISATGMKLLERDIAMGKSGAMSELGDVLADASYGYADVKQARDFFEAAYQKGDSSAALRLARLYSRPKGPLFDPKAAAEWLQRAAEAGSLPAARQLAIAGMFGGPVSVRRDIGRNWLDRALQLGDPLAHLYDATARGIENPAVNGEAELATLLADPQIAGDDLLKLGDVVARSGAQNAGRFSIVIYRAASARGGLEAEHRFARAVLRGNESATEAERAEAAEALQRSASKGHVSASLLLSRRYHIGDGAEPSWNKAVDVLQNAVDARGGDMSDDLALGLAKTLMYGDADARRKGLSLYEQAASRGNSDAMLALGQFYGSGSEPGRDPLLSRYWLELAIDAGNTDAATDLVQNLSQSYDPNDLRDAADLAAKLGRAGDPQGFGELLHASNLLDDAKLAKTVATAALAKDRVATLALIESQLVKDRGKPLSDATLKWLTVLEKASDLTPADRISFARIMVEANRSDLMARIEAALAGLWRDSAEAQSWLGTAYIAGLGGDDKKALGRQLLDDAGRRGWDGARVQLATALLDAGGQDSGKQAADLLRPLVRSDSPLRIKATFLLGRAYEHGLGTGQDLGRARQFYSAAAIDGSVPAMTKLGLLYANGGPGIAIDNDLALQWMRRAAAGSDAVAIIQYARFLASNAAGGVRNEDAFSQYLRAARLGSPDAMLLLGRTYLAGAGTARNKEQGIRWMKESAKAQNSEAMLELYEHARLSGASAEAATWLKKAAELGNLDAMYRLGLSPFVQSTASLSKDDALAWLQRAGQAGHRPSERALSVIVNNKPEEEVDE